MRPKTMIEANPEQQKRIAEDLRRWKRKLERQVLYATQKINEIDTVLIQLAREE